ncbi:MAG: hypothetical protein V1770_00480 [bacterium]
MYRLNNQKIEKMAKIAKFGQVLYHTEDLANLWQITKSNTLYTTIKRYIKKGILFKIYKGFYSIKPIEDVEPFLLGSKALHEYCYVSAETVLAQEGIIQQNIDYITFISSRSKHFSIGENNYYSRRLKDEFLFQQEGIIEKNGIKFATVNRAIADILYFNPKTYFDAAKFIDWKEVRKMQKRIGYRVIDLRVIRKTQIKPFHS